MAGKLCGNALFVWRVNVNIKTMLAVAALVIGSSATTIAADAGKCPAGGTLCTAKEQNAELYQCPMHPEVTSHDAHAKCPKCGMFLEKVQAHAQHADKK